MPTSDLLVPCPLCGEDIPIALRSDDAGRGWRAPGLIDVMNAHVISIHNQEVSGT